MGRDCHRQKRSEYKSELHSVKQRLTFCITPITVDALLARKSSRSTTKILVVVFELPILRLISHGRQTGKQVTQESTGLKRAMVAPSTSERSISKMAQRRRGRDVTLDRSLTPKVAAEVAVDLQGHRYDVTLITKVQTPMGARAVGTVGLVGE